MFTGSEGDTEGKRGVLPCLHELCIDDGEEGVGASVANDAVDVAEDFKGDGLEGGLACASADRVLFWEVDASGSGLAAFELVDDKGGEIARGVFLALEDAHEVLRGERVEGGRTGVCVARGDVAGWAATEVVERRGQQLGYICGACEIDDEDGVGIGQPWLVETAGVGGSSLADLPLGKRAGPRRRETAQHVVADFLRLEFGCEAEEGGDDVKVGGVVPEGRDAVVEGIEEASEVVGRVVEDEAGAGERAVEEGDGGGEDGRVTGEDTLVDAEGDVVVGDEHDVAVAEPQLHLTVRIFYSHFLFFLPCPNNALSPALLPQLPHKRLSVKNGGPRTPTTTTPRRTLSPRSPSTSPTTTTQNPASSLICSPSARGRLQKKSHVPFPVFFSAAHFFLPEPLLRLCYRRPRKT